jgi:hypothetical protein
MDFNNDSGTLANVSVIGSSTSNTVTMQYLGGMVLPTGATADRPATPTVGTSRYNTTLGKTEYWNGTIWQFDVVKISECTDTVITSPVSGQVLQFNGTKWANTSSSTPSSAAGTLSSWTLVAGSRYYADFAHNLGTTNVVVQLFDSTTNTLVQADSIVLTDVNTVRVTIIGNTRSIRIVVIANGMYIGNVSSGTAILEDIFANRPAAGIVDRLFLAYDTKVFYRDNGTSWDIMSASSGTVKTYTFYPNSLDSPNTADFAVNSLAPVISDPLNTAMNVRSFSNTVEQGVGFMIPVPTGSTTVTFNIRGRAATAPATATTVTHKLYSRQVPTNAAMGAWSAASTFTALTVPTNAYYQIYSQSYSLAAAGLAVGNTYHFELTRAVSGLAYAWLVAEIAVVFT